MIRRRRVYAEAAPGDGTRVLVDRVWPRGVAKERARVDAWFKEVAPSSGLRKWFAHDPERWEEFRRRYWEELEAERDACEELLRMARRGNLTLVYAAKDEEHNNAVALQEYLQRRLDSGGPSPATRRRR